MWFNLFLLLIRRCSLVFFTGNLPENRSKQTQTNLYTRAHHTLTNSSTYVNQGAYGIVKQMIHFCAKFIDNMENEPKNEAFTEQNRQ